MSWVLRITSTVEESVESSSSLRSRLQELNAELKASPTLVQLVAPDKATLSVGLGHDMSVLNYVPPDGWPASTSLGDEDEEGVLEYRVWDEITELPTRHAVAFGDAIEVAVMFFDTQQLSDKVVWETD